MSEENCLFCGILKGRIPSYSVAESDKYLAILDKYPSIRGQTLVMPKQHRDSYVFDLNEIEYLEMMAFARRVGLKLDKKLGAVRTCMVAEGLEVPHAHIKLYPIQNIITNVAEGQIDLNDYQGFISTLHGAEATNSELEKMAKQIAPELHAKIK